MYLDFRPSPRSSHGVEAIVKMWGSRWLSGQTRPTPQAKGCQAPILFLQRHAYSWVGCSAICFIAW